MSLQNCRFPEDAVRRVIQSAAPGSGQLDGKVQSGALPWQQHPELLEIR